MTSFSSTTPDIHTSTPHTAERDLVEHDTASLNPASPPSTANSTTNSTAKVSVQPAGSDHSHPLDNSKNQPPHSHGTHQHSEASTKQIIHRLSRLEGHIRGIKTMVQDQRNCPDVLIQVAAVRGGLDRVARLILDAHLSECISRAAAEGNIQAEIDELKSALDRFIV